MGVELNADDVFEMAEQIEKDASAFYQHAAAATADPTCRQALLKLAAMEDEHVLVFGAMKTHLAAQGWTRAPVEGGNEIADNWAMLSNLLASGVKEHLAEYFASPATSQDILRKAIEFEKDTIVFLAGMKNMLPDSAEKERVEGIIREEVGHIITLAGELAAKAGIGRNRSTGTAEAPRAP